MSILPCKPARRSSLTAGCPSSGRASGDGKSRAIAGLTQNQPVSFLACNRSARSGIPDRSAFAVRETGRADSITLTRHRSDQ